MVFWKRLQKYVLLSMVTCQMCVLITLATCVLVMAPGAAKAVPANKPEPVPEQQELSARIQSRNIPEICLQQ